MSRSSGRRSRGQVEPLAALAAVFAFGAALALYAAALPASTPADADRDVAPPVLDRVTDRVLYNGVVDPENVTSGITARPEGYQLRVTLIAGNDTWRAGPTPPPTADAATRRVSVRRWPGRVDPGRLRVEVWT
jgi:hypothetical protein